MLIKYAFNKIAKHTKWGAFELLIISCLIFIGLFALYRLIKGEDGTWTKEKYYNLLPYSKTETIKKDTQSNKSKGEIECKKVLENIFKKPFISIRPDFLKNTITGGNNLELDCYNSELKIAVEYNGIQHYKFSPFFHKNKDQFHNQKYRDDIKKRLCEENGILLIEVPYTVKLEDIDKFIKTKLFENGKL
jgi:hypothetical protein